VLIIPHLETNVTVACQLSCVSCNHFVAIQRGKPARLAKPEQLEADLGHLVKAGLQTQAWGALGGEPLTHPALPELLSAVRRSGITKVIEVWTNGIALRRQKDSFWSAEMDRLVVSVYPHTTTGEDLDWIAAQCAERNIKLVVKDERHVPNFEQLLEPTPTGPNITKAKYDACFFRQFSRVIDNGYLYRCCTSPFIPRLLMGLPEETDGLKVEGTTESAIRAFLGDSRPARSCERCVGLNPGERRRTQWREVKDPEQWELASSGRIA
jgi:organic radical activating enzyme